MSGVLPADEVAPLTAEQVAGYRADCTKRDIRPSAQVACSWIVTLCDSHEALRAERDLFRDGLTEAQRRLVWLDDVAKLARQCPEGTQVTITVPDHLAAERLDRLERDLHQAGVQRETQRQVAADAKREVEALRSQLAAAHDVIRRQRDEHAASLRRAQRPGSVLAEAYGKPGVWYWLWDDGGAIGHEDASADELRALDAATPTEPT